jgi:hypothetical protein
MATDDELEHKNPYRELMVSGLIYPACMPTIAVEIRRGMAILTGEGREAGRVAAVLIDSRDGQVTHILLGRHYDTPEYRLVPVDLVEQVREESVLLRILDELINRLPTWHGT